MTDTFYAAVRLLRVLAPEYRVMALHAALFWSDDRLNATEMEGALPGQPGELAKPKAAPVLNLFGTRQVAAVIGPSAAAGSQAGASLTG